MGQSISYPECIRPPDNKTLATMNECGIIIVNNPNNKSCDYLLPIGWRTDNYPNRRLASVFVIVDNKNMVRFMLTRGGSQFFITSINNPYNYEPYF